MQSLATVAAAPAAAALKPVQPRPILRLVPDVVHKIAFESAGIFRNLALIHPRFAYMLRNPDVQARAKQAFARQHVFVQAFSPNFTVVADLLPNGWAHGYVQLYDGDDLRVSAQFKDNRRHGEEYRMINDGEDGWAIKEKTTTYHEGIRCGPQLFYSNGREVECIVWADNDTKKFHSVDDMGFLTETIFVNGHPNVVKEYDYNGLLSSIVRYRQEPPINTHCGDHTHVVLRDLSRKKVDLAKNKLYYLSEIEPKPERSHPVDKLKYHGECMQFEDGKLLCSANYRNGELHGRYRSYDLSTEELVSDLTYSYGIRHGPAVTYYPSGKLQSLRMYENGKLSGEILFYYEMAAIKRRSYYEKGVLHGTTTIYGQDGSVEAVVEFKEGSRTEYTEYNPDGSVAVVGECEVTCECGYCSLKLEEDIDV